MQRSITEVSLGLKDISGLDRDDYLAEVQAACLERRPDLYQEAWNSSTLN